MNGQPHALDIALMAGRTTRKPITIPVGLTLGATSADYFNITKIVRSTKHPKGDIYLIEGTIKKELHLNPTDTPVVMYFYNGATPWTLDTTEAVQTNLSIVINNTIKGSAKLKKSTTGEMDILGDFLVGEKFKICYTVSGGTWEYVPPTPPPVPPVKNFKEEVDLNRPAPDKDPEIVWDGSKWIDINHPTIIKEEEVSEEETVEEETVEEEAVEETTEEEVVEEEEV